ncbi:NDR1/HIN1-like protein 10 [Phragmites australis]|uniref:NDR1/HIN1-like protein 10 n=1 Tax=Phragmites australis TaxID=29695 RepID=UPI002D79D1F5|nr:NDR1/HIN1-like protein 10 [Phragmites australis]
MAMASHEHKVDHLDQPYYGSPIPPNEPAAAGGVRPARRDTYTLLCRAFRVLTLVLIALGVLALVLWLVYQPSSLKAYVDSAALTRFDLANGTRLRYNLTVGVSIRNPNRKQAVLYRRLEAVALYGGERFGYVDLSRMRQERKSTVEIRPSFHGEGALVGAPAVALFSREKEEGFFNINVKLHTRVRLKVIMVNSVEYRPDVDCYIRVPDPTNATAMAQGFTPTQCHVDDFS